MYGSVQTNALARTMPGLGGQIFERLGPETQVFEIHPRATVKDLKEKIERTCSILCAGQVFVIVGKLLRDG